MNKYEVKNLAAGLAVLLAPLAVKYGLSVGELTQIGVGVIPVAYLAYSHWNMVKVHEDDVEYVDAEDHE